MNSPTHTFEHYSLLLRSRMSFISVLIASARLFLDIGTFHIRVLFCPLFSSRFTLHGIVSFIFPAFIFIRNAAQALPRIRTNRWICSAAEHCQSITNMCLNLLWTKIVQHQTIFKLHNVPLAHSPNVCHLRRTKRKPDHATSRHITSTVIHGVFDAFRFWCNLIRERLDFSVFGARNKRAHTDLTKIHRNDRMIRSHFSYNHFSLISHELLIQTVNIGSDD